MATKSSWEGFKPDTSPLPEAQSPQDRLAELDKKLDALEGERKAIYEEVQKAEVLEKLLSGEIDLTAEQEKDLHVDCHSIEEVEDLTTEAEGLEDEAWSYIQEFGGHTGTCLCGALAGVQALHHLCTCGWNHVATALERRGE